MENNIAISCRNLTKDFKVYFDKGSSLKEKILFRNRRRYEDRIVLDDVSFDVKKGEAIGIIGENGCGKSTLLKLLSRILYPDNGTVEIEGRVSALIELGAGFHPDMSGRENIYTNASIFGLKKEEIDDRLQAIIDFSELGDYIDNPVRTYSSGMYMRLAFAVAINVDADVLLVDEILAVGDAAFQAKCFNRLREIKAAGTTIVIVSHSLGQIEQICERSLWICDGKIRAEGSPREVHPAYLDFMNRRNEHEPAPEPPVEEEEQPKNRWGNGNVRISALRLFTDGGEEVVENVQLGTSLRVEMEYACKRPLKKPQLNISFYRTDGVLCYATGLMVEDELGTAMTGQGTVTMEIGRILLLPAQYSIDVSITGEDGFAYDDWHDARRFVMCCPQVEPGIVRLEHTWECTQAPDAKETNATEGDGEPCRKKNP